MNPIALCVLLLLAVASISSEAETPTQAVDRLWSYEVDHSPGDPLSDRRVIRFSKQIADEEGIAVIAPIMVRSKEWKGEEEVYFAPLVTQLPAGRAIPILLWYYLHGKPWEKTAANDLLTEIDESIQENHHMSDAARKRLFAGWDGEPSS